MYFLSSTRPTPAENLALDEALLDQAIEDQTLAAAGEQTVIPAWSSHHGQVLRLWEAESPFVVLGSSSQINVEVNRAACQAENIPILRRVSGGATIITGPGCLMYAVVLSYEQHPELRDLDQAHRFVMTTLCNALSQHISGIAINGISDLTYQGRKFSGNSLRCKKSHFLYHGTLMYGFDLAMIPHYLGQPVRMPEYRQARSHADFVTNLPLERSAIMATLRQAFGAAINLPVLPLERMAGLCFSRYFDPAWHTRL